MECIVRAGFVLVALAACTVNAKTSGSEAQPGEPLEIDTYFMYASGPTPCNMPVIDACIFEVGFCSDGTYALKFGDIITRGTYVTDELILVDSQSGFQFDLQSDFSDDKNNNNLGPWTSTTGSTVPDVACMQ